MNPVPAYAITARNLAGHEVIGLHVRVARARDAGLEGLEGRVVWETARALVLGTPRGPRTVPKQGARFVFTLPGGERAELDGERLLARPHARTKVWRKLR